MIGISPTDFVKGGQLMYKAGTAISEGSNGSRAKYQESTNALDARSRAAKELRAGGHLRSSGSAPSQDALHSLQDDKFLDAKRRRYESSLGHNAATGWRHGMKRKLQYANSGSKQFEYHINATKPTF